MTWIIGWIVHFFRELKLRAALRERKKEIANDGLCLSNAYMLINISKPNGKGFKPGKKDEMENEMRVKYERMKRIDRRLRRGWFTRRRQLGTPPPLTPEEKAHEEEIKRLETIRDATMEMRDALQRLSDSLGRLARGDHDSGQGLGQSLRESEPAGRGCIETSGEDVTAGDQGAGRHDPRAVRAAQVGS